MDGKAGLHVARKPLSVIAFFLVLGTAWIVANPPGYTPDEPAHYTKAVGVGHRVWVGRPGAYPVGPGFGPLQLEWINQAARVVTLPPHMAPDGFACSIFQPHRSAACLNGYRPPAEPADRLTYVGTYEPFLYVPPGLALRVADDATSGLLLGRLASGAIALTLLALAVAVLWRPGEQGLPVLGVVAAVTPMVVFLASGLAPSGPELAAAVCCTAAALRLARAEPPTELVWLAVAGGGAVLAIGRSLGPYFLSTQVALLLLLVGPRKAVALVRGGGVAAFASVAVVGASVVANLAWGMAVQPKPPFSLDRVLAWIGPSIREVPEVLRQDVGVFGWADVGMPAVAYLLWGAMVVAVVGTAFAVGSRRQRIQLGAVVGGCFFGTVVIAAVVIHQTHFPMYGRYALPLWITVPMLAGEIVRANRDRLGALRSSLLLPGAAVVAATVHFVGFYANARRYAVGDDGPVLFLGSAEWTPPGGWLLWLAAVALACAGLVGFGFTAAREPALDRRSRQRSMSRTAPSTPAGGATVSNGTE